MIDTIWTAVVLGFFAGAIPGPYTAIVASTALERGFKPAFRLAFVPVVTDMPPMFVMALVLDRVNFDVLTVVGICGGVILAWVGVHFVRRQGTGWRESVAEVKEGRNFWAIASAGLLSPAPWLFWLIVGAPLLLRAWNRYWGEGVVFGLILFGMLIGTATGLAWITSHGHRMLDDRWRRRILRGVGVLLVLLGSVMVWQSFEGNFQFMVQQQQKLRERVENGPTG